MADQIKIFDFSFGDTVENIARLKAELKETRKAFEQAAPKSEAFNQLGVSVKSLESQIKALNGITKQNQNALGGINNEAKFAAGSYGELKQKIDAQRKSLLELTIDSEEFNAAQKNLIALQNERIAVESKIPSLFQERIKGAIDESNALKQLKAELKQAQALALNGDGAAAQKVAELTNKINNLKDSTKSLQGTGVERLNASMSLLTDAFQNLDLDKAKTGFKALGSAMSAIPLVLIIEGIKALIDNFDEVVKFAKEITSSFSAAEKQVRELTIATEKQSVANKGLINQYTNEIALLTAKGGHEREIIELKKKKIAVEIAEAENTVRLNSAKVAEAVLNNSIADSVNNITVSLFRKIGATETADKLDAINSKVKKARVIEEQKDNIKAIEEAKLSIATSKNELLVIDAEYNKKQVEQAKEKNKKLLETDKERYKQSVEDYNNYIKTQEEMQKQAAETEENIRKATADAQQKRLAQYYEDAVARANGDLINAQINHENTLDEQLAFLKAQQEQELSNTELTEAQKYEIKSHYAQLTQQAQQQAFEQDITTAGEYADAVGSITNSLFEIKRSTLEKGTEEDKAAAEQQFNVNKAFGIVAATIDGILAVQKALSSAPYPANLLLAAASGGMAAANVAKISNQEFQYYDGGYTGEGNPREVSTNLGRRNYTYHKDEYITPSRVLNTPEGAYHVSKLEAMRQGVTPSGLAGFFDGGYTVRAVSSQSESSIKNVNDIIGIIQSQPTPVVRVTDINNVSKSNEVAISVSQL